MNQKMHRRYLHYGFLTLFLGIFLWGLNARYPLIGEDYFYVFPRLLEGKWHFLRQGIAPLRFAPHLCGGFPQYGNPQDHFYSMAQFLSFFLNLWTATQLSLVITMIVGYVGWVRLGKDILKLSSAWSHLLALVCIASGFYFMHMLVGHLWIISLPLLSWLLWLLFLPGREERKTLWTRAAFFGGVSSYILYSGSQTLVFLFVLIIAAIVPLDLLLAENFWERLKILLRRIGAYGCVALLFSASKLVAVYSLMRSLNVEAAFSNYHAGESMLLLMLKSFWGLPQAVSLFPSTVSFSRLQEESMFTSHVALVGIVGLIYLLVRNRLLPRGKTYALMFYAALLTAFLLALVRGSGIVPETLQDFPLFSALRVPERFLYILSLLVSLGGVWGAARIYRTFFSHLHEYRVVAGAALMTILGFLIAYVPPLRNDPISISLPYEDILQFEREHPGYLKMPVREAFEPEGGRVSDFHYLFSASTGTQCYEAIPHDPPHLRNGPVDMVYDNAFNIYNPVCLQYPKENNCHLYERISVEDRDNFLLFTHGEKTTWKLSTLQVWADRVTVFSFLGVPIALFLVKRRKATP